MLGCLELEKQLKGACHFVWCELFFPYIFRYLCDLFDNLRRQGQLCVLDLVPLGIGR